MVNGVRTSELHGLNKKGHGSKFRIGSRVWQETPEEGQRTYQTKRCDDNKDEDNSPKTLNNKKHLFH